jgi:hypothetical protein
MNASVPVVSAAIGAIVLLFGRKLFWLCVAAVGFAAGVELAPQLVHEPTPLLQLTIALVLGFVGALLALLLQKLAIGIAGFLIGGRIAVAVAATFVVAAYEYYWLTFVIGGVIGAILMLGLFDWAVIVLSSLVGAHLVVGAVVLPPTGATVALVALTILGFAVQAGIQRRQRRSLAD